MHNELRASIEGDILKLAAVIAPYRYLGTAQKELLNFLVDSHGKSAKLGLMPRGHQKSWCMALYTVWLIINNPAITVLYVSATSPLAIAQLRDIKQMLEHPMISLLYPDLLHKLESKRAKWSTTEIIVDSPLRRLKGVREETVKAAGLTTNITGTHFDVIIADDLVVPQNNTVEGRNTVEIYYSQFYSILNPGGTIRCVGTRYHAKDIYGKIKEERSDIFENGEVIGSEASWDILEKVVEEDGEFLWPRTEFKGQYYGFDDSVLSKVKAGYKIVADFYSQYYNDPNRGGAAKIKPEMFHYYNRDKLQMVGGNLSYRGRPLRVYASIDFAYTVSEKSDYTTICVIGIDDESNIYVLDIVRFKTEKIKDYFENVKRLYQKWNFRLMRAESTAAQRVIVEELKEYLKTYEIKIKIEMFAPTRNKQERMMSELLPKYETEKMFHYVGGNTDLLEEELLSTRPAHDDIMDALANAVAIAKPPPSTFRRHRSTGPTYTLNKFGGY